MLKLSIQFIFNISIVSSESVEISIDRTKLSQVLASDSDIEIATLFSANTQ
jgi:hypothetical protein